jgi:hypothetical protein
MVFLSLVIALMTKTLSQESGYCYVRDGIRIIIVIRLKLVLVVIWQVKLCGLAGRITLIFYITENYNRTRVPDFV